MRRFVLTAALLALLTLSATAQKQANVWYFGSFVGMSFNGPSPVALLNGAQDQDEGTASICDPATDMLLFYTDGVKVWDRTHQRMQNGFGLGGDFSASQSALIVRDPLIPSRYYIFTVGATKQASSSSAGLSYSTVGMTLQSGYGDVIDKNRSLFRGTTEHLTGVRHCDGESYWIISHVWGSNRFLAYALTPSGLSAAPVASDIGPSFNFEADAPTQYQSDNSVGYLKASPNGRRLAVPQSASETLLLFDFDPTTGIVSNPITIPNTRHVYGVSFSPDNNLLYTADPSTGLIMQYDIRSTDPAAIEASRYQVARVDQPGALQIGPNGKIYVAHNQGSVSVINNPNTRGELCAYGTNGLNLKAGCRWGLPNFIDAEVLNLPIGCTRPAAGLSANRTSICAGECITYSDRSQGSLTSWRWTFEGGIPGTSNSPNPPQVCYPTPGAWRTTLIVSNGSIADTTTMDVTVNAPPTPTTSNDTTICIGEGVRLHAGGGITYRWNSTAELSCLTCPDPIARPQSTATYTVTVTDTNGCQATDSVTVTVLPGAIAEAGEDKNICEGEGVRLEGSGGGTYEWEPATGLSCTDCPTPIASPAATTTYRLHVSVGTGCTESDSVTVTVLPRPTATISPDVAVCTGGSAKLTAAGGTTYRWEPASGLSCSDCPVTVATPTATTTYRVIVGNADGCTDTAQVTVTVHPIPEADAGNDRTLCAGEAIMLSAGGGTTYLWAADPTLSCLDCPNPIARPTTTTTYHVVAIGDGGCRSGDSVTISVAPAATVSARGDGTICPGDSVQLGAEGEGTFAWIPAAGLSCSDCAAPVARPNVTTTYTVTLTSTSGCRASDTVTVTVLDAAVPVRAHISRDLRYMTAIPRSAPLVLDEPLDAFSIGSLTATIHYNLEMLRFRSAATADLTGGWGLTTSEPQPGTIIAQLTAPPGRTLQGIGSLLQLEFMAYLGPVAASEIPFELAFGEWSCLRGETTPGLITLDSICGLTYRLVEAYGKRYALDNATPNPFNPTADIRFSLGLDGPTRLVVFNALGEDVAVLVDDYLQPGTYQATWDATEYPAGLYYYRLTSGVWSASGVMVLRK